MNTPTFSFAPETRSALERLFRKNRARGASKCVDRLEAASKTFFERIVSKGEHPAATLLDEVRVGAELTEALLAWLASQPAQPGGSGVLDAGLLPAPQKEALQQSLALASSTLGPRTVELLVQVRDSQLDRDADFRRLCGCLSLEWCASTDSALPPIRCKIDMEGEMTILPHPLPLVLSSLGLDFEINTLQCLVLLADEWGKAILAPYDTRSDEVYH
jgi:hypothetical protein